jgi:2-C-methyl-D-erythritol 2,4-cyclodiphosphate synthase
MQMSDVRTGIGYDVHPFAMGRKLILGGVEIKYTRGLTGHSDADVLTHAIIDALLGAAGLGDIGERFPDSEAQFKDIDSQKLLAETKRYIDEAGFVVSHVDTTVIAEAPRLSDYKQNIRQSLARTLAIPLEKISVKATTTEKLGFTGRGEGIAALAIATLVKDND